MGHVPHPQKRCARLVRAPCRGSWPATARGRTTNSARRPQTSLSHLEKQQERLTTTRTQIRSPSGCFCVGRTRHCLARSGRAHPTGRELRAGRGITLPGSRCRHLLELGKALRHLANLSSAQGWGLDSSAWTPLLAAGIQPQIPQDIFPPLL